MSPIAIDIDRDGVPEILFVDALGSLIFADSRACLTIWRGPIGQLLPSSGLASADVDGDGSPEVIAVSTGTILVFNVRGEVVAFAPRLPGAYDAAPMIADIDNLPPAEILVDGTVYRMVSSGGALSKVSSIAAKESYLPRSIFADIDEDGRPEVIAGHHVYDAASGQDRTPQLLRSLPFVSFAVPADADGDGHSDLFCVDETANTQFSVFSFAKNEFLWNPSEVGDIGAGAPVVGDIDGDRLADLIFGTETGLHVYSSSCRRDPTQRACIGTPDGLLWFKRLQDVSSLSSPATMFDFNGDGTLEIVYRDECWLRVFDSLTGEVLSALAMRGSTVYTDGPLVVAAGGDDVAEIIVPSSVGGDCTMTVEADTHAARIDEGTGVYVLGAPRRSWQGTRALWSDFNFHSTEINDDLSVPIRELPSWATTNTYRMNVQHQRSRLQATSLLPDFTARLAPTTAHHSGLMPIAADICNRGAVGAGAGVAGTFYDAARNNNATQRLCTAYTTMVLEPGMCETVWCEPQLLCPKTGQTYFYVNDHGNGRNVIDECNRDNNLAILPACQLVPN